ncbi:hypothetical protein QD47_24970 [Paenibacillus terrae]|uniref:Uncharacterized protein n=1 Tax=Paenibacillus terrae TaxID=159743 RepID=A0A0D7WWB0_9BACL|nr:hypothetical protein QD47_24970 [Paenibacillus terrae]
MYEITRDIGDYTRQIWTFHLSKESNRLQIKLNSYRLLKRESRRHKYKETQSNSYDAVFRLGNTMLFEDVPFPEDVLAEVREAVINSVEFKNINTK